MKVLWITNILLPEAKFLLNGYEELRASGGWMVGAANGLVENSNIELAIASVADGITKLVRRNGPKISYYYIPLGKGNTRINNDYEIFCREINNDFYPDVVHIHGSEYSHGLAYVRACGSSNVVLSIQGMTSVYAKYYNYGLTRCEILRNITLRDCIKRSTLLTDQEDFYKRGKYELELLKALKHVIGRTSWDYANVLMINPNIQYHFCNETLRSQFYTGKWEYSKCDKNTIFCSSAQDPIKGFHQLLKSLFIVKREIPEIKVKVAGLDVTKSSLPFGRFKRSGYGKIISKLIKKYNLEDNVEFLGSLDAEQMKTQYLKANLFVCPSSIENSPNSLGEAQILGVPCIATYTGGVMNMIPDSQCGKLVRFEEIGMMAIAIVNTLKESEYFDNSVEISTAKSRHDSVYNAECLYNIYREIIS